MKLEKQVCSLELAKKLKELGALQDSLFVYYSDNEPFYKIGQWNEFAPHNKVYHKADIYPAFTAAELGEILPKDKKVIFRKEKYFGEIQNYLWVVIYCEDNKNVEINLKDNLWFGGYTEADAKAKMLVYLIEEGLYEKQIVT